MVIYGRIYRLSKKTYRLDNISHKRNKICYYTSKESEKRKGGDSSERKVRQDHCKDHRDLCKGSLQFDLLGRTLSARSSQAAQVGKEIGKEVRR